jgi:4,5-dihydroxyphthalate decarboxylase
MSAVARLPLRMACGFYDRVEALASGAVQAEGVSLTLHPPDAEDCEIREIALATYLTEKARGNAADIAIPVFPLRSFCHGLIFVNGSAGIAGAPDLAGKRIGVAVDRDTEAMWICGALQHEHGVARESLTLVDCEAKALASRLAAGEIDAAFGLRLPTAAPIRPLFPDHAARDRDVFEKTGIFPIMTVLVMPQSLHARHPWLAESLFKACDEAKRWCLRQMRFSGALRTMLPWLLDEIDEMDRLFGADPWPYAVEANRRTLAMAAQLLREQGRISGAVAIDGMFTPIVAWAE